MPLITGTRTRVHSITVPQDGKDVDAASVGVPFGGLITMTSWLEGKDVPTVSLSGPGPHEVTIDGHLGQILRVITDGACTITITPTNFYAGGRYALVLEHLHTGTVSVTWGGAPVYFHRWRQSVDLDGQPRPGSGRTVWTANVYAGIGDAAGTLGIRWVADSGNVDAGSLRHRGMENTTPGMRVDASGGFVATISGTFTGAIAPGAPGSVDVWQTPAEPILVEGAVIEITGAASAGVNPGQVTMALEINGQKLVEGQTEIFGTSYDPSTKKAVVGLDEDEYGPLLSGDPLTDNGKGTIGAQAGGGKLLIFRDGGADGFWLQDVSLTFATSGASTTITVPFRVRIFGRRLVAS